MDTSHFKQKLLDEKIRLESELGSIAKKDPNNPSDWSAVTDEIDSEPSADKNDRADAIEDLEENTGITNELEARLKDVNDALDRIEKGTFGKDETTGEDIAPDRLEANPAARTNI
ncbi:MAG: hypothetical protein AAB458_02490 [Patescibacteria group bacterium]